MPDKLLHSIPWSETEELRVSENEFKGKKYLAVRVWFQGRDDSDKMFPGKQGINVPVEKIDEFFFAVKTGINVLREGPPKKSSKKVGGVK